MQIELDPNPCIAGWGPCIWGFAHACDRGGGHTGSHHCGQCDARTKDRPSLWECDCQCHEEGGPVSQCCTHSERFWPALIDGEATP